MLGFYTHNAHVRQNPSYLGDYIWSNFEDLCRNVKDNERRSWIEL
jgi:hypothetical protein